MRAAAFGRYKSVLEIPFESEGGTSLRTHASAATLSAALALISIGFWATPSLWAQDNEWDKHQKAGSKAYAEGWSQKCYYRLRYSPNPAHAPAGEAVCELDLGYNPHTNQRVGDQ
jgi:hypothetical protein